MAFTVEIFLSFSSRNLEIINGNYNENKNKNNIHSNIFLSVKKKNVTRRIQQITYDHNKTPSSFVIKNLLNTVRR